ncbi:MAG: hypothetical protein NWE92_11865 [Candidatus Bathyarchaeota archaeon]|nr:hypothetical protein [Candidatus Bathyarchaeota archaeon]
MISSSVKAEGFQLIDKSVKAIINNFQLKLRPFLEEKGKKAITNKDALIFAEFFTLAKKEFRALPYRKSNLQNEILGTIESYVANQVHSIEDGKEYTLDVFLGAISAELSIKRNALERPFRGMRCENIEPLEAIKTLLYACAGIKNTDDVEHLSSAFQFQFNKNKWVIFVTLDEEDILDNTGEFNEILLLCSRPDWASDFSRTLTKNKEPRQHLKELKNLTEKQKKANTVVADLINTLEKPQVVPPTTTKQNDN